MNMFASILSQSRNTTFWMPEQASTVAGEVDWLFYFILYICYFFFFLIVVLMLGFVIKYRKRPGVPDHAAPAGHSTALEMLWTIPPTLIVLFIAYKGIRGYMDMAVAPPNCYEITVKGQMWSWSFTYPNGATPAAPTPENPNDVAIPELHIWKDQPIRLVLESTDVIHSFYIPAFRLKKDAVPGRFNKFWFQATRASPKDDKGNYIGFPVYCAEYCGTSHSEMLAKVIVHPTREDFELWLADASKWEDKMTYQERGAQLWSMYCRSCHSVDGSANTGPTWKNLYGSKHSFADGSGFPYQSTEGWTADFADENYIRESIYYPQRKIVAGYPAGQMNSFLGQLTEEDVKAITWYMKSISANYTGALPSAPPQAPGGQPAPGEQPQPPPPGDSQ
ncbi:MAG: cytochrome c oxidase subunit II [Phycisphaerae bacterium]|nr:cytochrome c oxidase subunit II [Phycisphaerae bacterium]MDW8262034.1 cytochrome c oxidase subunit II [Phycisphaerales bacterium]